MANQAATIFGYRNNRYHVPENNPFGHVVWYATRAERDAARTRLITRAGGEGLSDAARAFPRVKRVIRGEAAHAWLDELREAEVLREMDSTSHEWASLDTAA